MCHVCRAVAWPSVCVCVSGSVVHCVSHATIQNFCFSPKKAKNVAWIYMVMVQKMFWARAFLLRTQAQHEQITNNSQCIYVLIADLTVGGWCHSNAWPYFVMSAFDTDFATAQWVERCGHVCRSRKWTMLSNMHKKKWEQRREQWIMWHAWLNGRPKLFQCKIFIYQILQIDLCPRSSV